MNQVANTVISGLVGVASYFLGLGFNIPPGGEGFHFFATFAAIAGFGVGSVFSQRAASYRLVWLGITILVVLLIGLACALGYMLLQLHAVAGPRIFIWLALLLTGTFFCLGAVLPLAGVSFGK